MKRKQDLTNGAPKPKKARIEVPEYHLTPSIKEEDGSIQWPAPSHQIEKARDTILKWQVSVRLGMFLLD